MAQGMHRQSSVEYARDGNEDGKKDDLSSQSDQDDDSAAIEIAAEHAGAHDLNDECGDIATNKHPGHPGRPDG